MNYLLFGKKRHFIKLSVVTMLMIAYSACNSAAEDTVATSNTTAANGLPVNSSAVAVNGAPVAPVSDVETKEIEKGFPVPVNANVTVVNSAGNITNKPTLQPGPESSTFSTEMNGKGQPVETRAFKNNYFLDKIEKITLSPRDYVFKIYLKDGRVIESKSDKLKDFRIITPLTILDAVGIKAPPPKADPLAPTKEESKKPVLIPRAN